MSTSNAECFLSFLRLKIHTCLAEIMSALSILFIYFSSFTDDESSIYFKRA